MNREKYNNPKVRVGDKVYFYDDDEDYETKCKYRVLRVKARGIIVEVSGNREDEDIINGWRTDDRSEKNRYNLPDGIKAWHVNYWRIDKRNIEIE